MPKHPQPSSSGKYAGIGFQLILICVGLVLFGRWLDSWFNLDSVFLLIGIFIAVFAVIYILIKKLK
ncbi:AtpZ/AtpI family protein [Bacteroidia bacterium]|nr:AtpZ/AtpI family protein [Bacteroidia bacterium]